MWMAPVVWISLRVVAAIAKDSHDPLRGSGFCMDSWKSPFEVEMEALKLGLVLQIKAPLIILESILSLSGVYNSSRY